jgi:tetratricopeptide (TPR) repeat protein
VFWLDADDRLDEDNRARLGRLFASLTDADTAFIMKCLCLPDDQTGTATVVDHLRLFRNDPRLRWTYRVHEQILPALRRLGHAVRLSDVVIHHTGYQDLALRKRKLQRDQRLLRLEDAERPGDPFTLFNLGQVAQDLGDLPGALACYQRSLERSQPTDSTVRKLYALAAQCHRLMGQKDLALAACQKGRGFYPDDVELLFQEGLVRRELGDRAGAESCLRGALANCEGPHIESTDTGLAGYKARHNLAVLYLEQGRHAEAEAEWRRVAAEQPGFLAARAALAELFLGQGRWAELEREVAGLEGLGGDGVREAAVVRARAHLGRKEFTAARGLLESAVARWPGEIGPRLLLSHALLQEGRDWEAAEKALRDVLALDPAHREAARNLALLLRNHGPKRTA